MTSKLNVKNRVKSNILRTIGGQDTARRRIDTNPCMLDKKTLRDRAADTRGGKSKLDEKTANRIRPTVARPKTRGS
jgi:hypothetical protein